MNCFNAGEYISALCDGEAIPPEAAAHLAECAHCQQRLLDYNAMGSELRQLASMEKAAELAPGRWQQPQSRIVRWWQKGWEQMRIPRVAFAMLVLCLVLLGTRLAMVEVGAHATGTGTLIEVDLGPGIKSPPCYLQQAEGSHATVCGFVGKRSTDQKTIGYEIQLKSFDGKRFQLGIRGEVIPAAQLSAALHDTMQSLPWQQIEFTPGKKSTMQLSAELAATLKGEWIDHVPSYMTLLGSPRIDPNAGEMRITSPLLLCDKAEAGDLEGAMVNSTGTDHRVVLYYPKVGLLIFSLEPFPDAVAAKVRDNRASFSADRHQYTLINAAPITRAEQIWVALKTDYKAPDQLKRGFLGNPNVSEMGRYLGR